MSTQGILALGAIAGVTIFPGLLVGRLRSTGEAWLAVLSAAATGILLFLLWDVLVHAIEPIEASISRASAGTSGWRSVWALSLLLGGGVAVGLCGLVHYDQWVARRDRVNARDSDEPRRLALLIAIGIGLHNFAEGLAIGQSSAAGETALAVTLVIGFALHNATEGFGIVAPLARTGTPASWGLLATLGLIGGGPTVAGTFVGQAWTSTYLDVAFLGLAAGSILYVVIELMHVNRGFRMKPLVTWGLLGGLVLGFSTDLVLGAVGG